MSASDSAVPEQSGDAPVPTAESYFWPLTALVVVILPQVLVPARMRLGPPSAVPIVEAIVVLLALTVAAKPGPVPRAARPLMLWLFGVLVLANTAAAARLVTIVLRGSPDSEISSSVSRLLVAAVIVLTTNIVTFGLLYWQLDGGGPTGRLARPAPYPDFQFPQTGTAGMSPPNWHPRFPDHLFVSFTNVVSFSPTDTLPLTTRVKGLMALQSMISVSVLVVVLARVINSLPS